MQEEFAVKCAVKFAVKICPEVLSENFWGEKIETIKTNKRKDAIERQII